MIRIWSLHGEYLIDDPCYTFTHEFYAAVGDKSYAEAWRMEFEIVSDTRRAAGYILVELSDFEFHTRIGVRYVRRRARFADQNHTRFVPYRGVN